MISVPWSVAVLLLATASGAVAGRGTMEDRTAFAEAVKEYRSFVTPRCAPEIVAPYISYNRRRDLAFVQSLKGTDLHAAYLEAVKGKVARDASTVYECSGPPPPPSESGMSAGAADPRTRVIIDAQERLSEAAKNVSAYFDRADDLFKRMAALRDNLLSRKGL